MAEILIETDQRDVRPSECKKQFMDYLSVKETAQIIQILSRTSTMKVGVDSDIDRSDYFGFSINAIDLIDYNSSLAYLTFNFPNILLPIFEDSVVEAQSVAMKNRSAPGLRVKRKVHVHIHSLPPVYEFCRTSIGQIRSLSDASSLLQVSGTVVRSGVVRLLEKAKTYQCMNPKCMFRFKVHADPEQGNVLPTPKCCPRKTADSSSSNPSEKTIKCTSTNVREVEGEREVMVRMESDVVYSHSSLIHTL
jgi:DNA replicative helicase MCM subunit Mcm2 (Cdc46/Mcm family)